MGFLFGCTDSETTNDSEFSPDHRILVFSKTAGWRHDSIEEGQAALKQLGEKHGVSVDISEDPDMFTSENLAKYQAVVFLSTTGEVFNDAHRMAMEQFIQSSGGFVGIHSATDTEYDWAWYNRLVGAYFDGHPPIQSAVIEVQPVSHPSINHLPSRWERTDEWYNFRNFNENVTVLMKLDSDSFDGSQHPGNHPIAWYHEFDGGRAFYTGLGHTKESFSEPMFLQHLWAGIAYAAGWD